MPRTGLPQMLRDAKVRALGPNVENAQNVRRKGDTMNLYTGRFVIILSFLWGSALGWATDGPAAEPGRKGSECPAPAGVDPALLDLIRRTQELAESSRAELARSREQSESLQRVLEETRQELVRLREEVSRLRAGMPAASTVRVEKTPQDQTVQSARQPQPPDTAAPQTSSLAGIKDQVGINDAQIRELDQTKVESDSRFKVRVFGTILSNTFFNTADSSLAAAPRAAPPAAAQGQGSGGNLGATLRQTEFGFALTGPKVGAARLSADVDFDFYGGTSSGYDYNVLGALRMRTATARLTGPRTSVAVGLMGPMISPLNPSSLASVYYPALGESGNLWEWLPQITVERRIPINEQDDLVLQGGLMMPFGDAVNGRLLQGRPGYESRIAFARTLDADRRLEIGVGGYFHRDLFGFGRSVDSYASTGDWLVPLGTRLELSGEAFYGRSVTLSEHSGGNIADMFAFTGSIDDPATSIRGVYSLGGWTQLKARATPRLEFNGAFGIDDPRNRDVFSGLFGNGSRLKNQTFSANSIFRLRSNFLVSFEYRRLWTDYPGARSTNDHFNLAVGYLF